MGKRRDTIDFGGAIKYYSLSLYAAQLEITEKQVLGMMRALRVPIIRMCGNRYALHSAFVTAMFAIGRIGEPDFLFPGQRYNYQRSYHPVATELDWDRLCQDEPKIISSLLHTLKIERVREHSELRTHLRQVFRKMRAGLTQQFVHPEAAQHEQDTKALDSSYRHGITPDQLGPESVGGEESDPSGE